MSSGWPMRLRTFMASSGFRRYFANTGWMFAEKAFSLVVGLSVGIYVARYLGPARYGLLNYALSFVGLYMVLCTLGLDELLVREFIERPDRRRRLVGTAFALKLAGAVVLLGGVYLGLLATGADGITVALVMLIAAGMLFESMRVFELVFRADVQARYSSVAMILSLLAINAFRLVLLWIEADLVWFAAAVLVQKVIVGGLLYLFYRWTRRHRGWRWSDFRPSLQEAGRLMRNAWPLIPADLAAMACLRVDQVMLKAMADNEAVGNYAAAVRISEAWYFIPAIVCSSLFPAIVNARLRDRSLYVRRLRKLTLLLTGIALSIATVMSLVARPLILLLYKEQFARAAGVLSIHAWVLVPYSLAAVVMRIVIAENRNKLLLLMAWSSATVNIVLNYVLIPTYGIRGAAMASLIAFTCYGLLYMVFRSGRSHESPAVD